MTYANNKGIPFVIMAGETERNNNTLTIKNMGSGTQEALSIEKVLERLTSC